MNTQSFAKCAQRKWMTSALSVMLVLVAGCGATTSTAREAPQATRGSEWTEAELEKLDPELRSRVRSGTEERIAVKVYFHELPTESELSDLLLNRLGDQAVGEVPTEELQRIAARGDVERIEALNDVGYEMLP